MMLGHGSFWLSIMMAALAFICLLCAGRLWRSPSLQTVDMILVMNAGMLLIHAAVVLGQEPPATAQVTGVPADAHHHGVSGALSFGDLGPPLDHSVLMVAATAVAFAEIIGALWLRSVWSQRRVIREGDDREESDR